MDIAVPVDAVLDDQIDALADVVDVRSLLDVRRRKAAVEDLRGLGEYAVALAVQHNGQDRPIHDATFHPRHDHPRHDPRSAPL